MIQIQNLCKTFNKNGTLVTVFQNFSVVYHRSELTTLVGPSGCGKTTLLNIIAGLETPDNGQITKPDRIAQRLGYMMQDPLLLPWRSLEENAMLGAEVLNAKSEKYNVTLDNYFSSFDLSTQKINYPDTSSGGMRQRVALIRTLIPQPTLLLLDEPFSNLDFDIKLKIQKQLIHYQQENNATIILVTHDIEDAIALSNRVIVLSERPAVIKTDIAIDLGTGKRDPVVARKSIKFREYFIQIWDELKYLNNND
jgi:NitT/TauT family transport system ATP-binding protein